MGTTSIAATDINALAEQLKKNRDAKKAHPSDRDARELVKRFREGDQIAFNQLVSRNQRLVIDIAYKYSKNPDFVQDLIQEGNLGLIRAIEKFNLNGKATLSTYATIWIKSNIETYISKCQYSFKVPQSSRKKAFKAFKMFDKLSEEGKSIGEITNTIAKELEVDEKAATKLIALKNASINMHDRRFVGSDGEFQTIEDTMESSVSVEEDVSHSKLNETIKDLVGHLPEKEKEAVSLYYGINGYPECGQFSEIGRYMNVTREYARILFNKGMNSIKGKDLKDLKTNIL